jgi:hypothetical protein
MTNRGTFAEDNERIEARNRVAVREYRAYRDWYDGMETVLDNLELADDPPVEVGLNTTQILLGIDTEIRTSQDNLKKQLDDIEASLNNDTDPVTDLRLDTLKTLAEGMVTAVQDPVSKLHGQRIEVTTTAKVNFIVSIKARVYLLKMLISVKFPVDARSANVENPRVQGPVQVEDQGVHPVQESVLPRTKTMPGSSYSCRTRLLQATTCQMWILLRALGPG